MKKYLLVYDDASNPDIDLAGFVDTLDNGSEMYTLDGHVCFLRSTLSVSELSKKFLRFAGSGLFFIVDVTSADYEGRMIGRFWDFLKQESFETAAE